MKFKIIDSHGHGHARESSSTTHKYLDELLDGTFITDYFLDRSTTSSKETDEVLTKS